MKHFSNMIIPAIASLLVLAACSKDKATTPSGSNNLAPLSIEFDNIVGGQNLQLNTGIYKNAKGEPFSVSLLQYFVSNISVKKADGAEYVVPQDSSYFMIRESDPATRFARVKVPEGEYTSVTFTLGVDSLRHTMDLARRKGVLDPAGGMEDGMYWGWTMGYIFLKLEGTSAAAPVDGTGQRKYRYHIGGYGSPNFNNIKTITIDLRAGGVAKVRQGREANIHLMADISKAFTGAYDLSIAEWPMIMLNDISIKMANNYAAMFRHDHTEN